MASDNVLKGTPKTLDEAIAHAHESQNEYATLKDFIAQKFAVAYLKADDKTLVVLEQLYKELTKRTGA